MSFGEAKPFLPTGVASPSGGGDFHEGGEHHEDPHICKSRRNHLGDVAVSDSLDRRALRPRRLPRKEVIAMKIRTSVKAGILVWGN